MRESELLRRIRAIFDRPSAQSNNSQSNKSGQDQLIVGNGDDGAILRTTDSGVVVATDVAVEGVHFKKEWSSGYEIGRKITAANLADICAMGGWPTFLLVSAVIPDTWIDQAEKIAQGIVYESDLVGAQVIGGDLSTGRDLTISITAMGNIEHQLLRSGARVGESVMVSSIPGWSAAGLSLLKSGSSLNSPLAQRAISQHKSPNLEYAKYRSAFTALTSATDISDGLLIDAGHIADASGVSIDLDSSLLVDAELSQLGDSREWILSGGEDHVLLGTTSEPEKCPGFIVIGTVRARGDSAVLIDGESIDSAGFQHEWRSSDER